MTTSNGEHIKNETKTSLLVNHVKEDFSKQLEDELKSLQDDGCEIVDIKYQFATDPKEVYTALVIFSKEHTLDDMLHDIYK